MHGGGTVGYGIGSARGRNAHMPECPFRDCVIPGVSESEQSQRFDHSFVIQMIRDFFLVLVVVVLLELGARFALVIYQFETETPGEVAIAADRLAENVRSIMLNRGGPVAARTVYPIIRRNHQEIGLEIAIEPSPVTVESIRKRFDETPVGIPADWPQGEYKAAMREIEAEPFCLQCHVTAGIGDVLGRVTVRSYLAQELTAWWHEVRVAGMLGMGKILAHTIILFLLLRIRMEPLMSLKNAVSQLARSGSRVTHHAPVKSRDEFGQLANDLNLFLERVDQVMEDLSNVLSNISDLTENLTEVHQRTLSCQSRLNELARNTIHETYEESAEYSVLNPEWMDTAEQALRTLYELGRAGRLPESESRRLDEVLARFRQLVEEARRNIARSREIGAGLLEFNRELNVSGEALQEMAVLEERMRSISGQGQRLLRRLRGSS